MEVDEKSHAWEPSWNHLCSWWRECPSIWTHWLPGSWHSRLMECYHSCVPKCEVCTFTFTSFYIQSPHTISAKLIKHHLPEVYYWVGIQISLFVAIPSTVPPGNLHLWNAQRNAWSADRARPSGCLCDWGEQLLRVRQRGCWDEQGPVERLLYFLHHFAPYCWWS